MIPKKGPAQSPSEQKKHRPNKLALKKGSLLSSSSPSLHSPLPQSTQQRRHSYHAPILLLTAPPAPPLPPSSKQASYLGSHQLKHYHRTGSCRATQSFDPRYAYLSFSTSYFLFLLISNLIHHITHFKPPNSTEASNMDPP